MHKTQKTHFLLLLFSVLVIGNTVCAQDQKYIASLRTALKNPSIKDNKKAEALAELAWNVSYYNLAEGLKYSEEAMQVAEKCHDLGALGHAQQVTAAIYMDMGEYPKAIDYFLKAMNTCDSAHDESEKAVAAGNLGIVYSNRGEYRKSIDTYMIGMKIFEKNKVKGVISSYLNICTSYLEMKKLDSAFYFANKALNGLDYVKPDSVLKASALGSLGEIYAEMKNYKLAEQYTIRSIKCLQDTSQHYYYAEKYVGLGAIQKNLNNLDGAIASTLKGLAYSKEVGLRENEKVCYELLSEIYEKKKNPLKALEYYRLFAQLKDSIFNQEQEKQVKFMEAKFETNQKEKEIALLSKDKSLQDEKLQKNKILINTFIFGGVILLIALGAVVFAFSNKRKANKKLVVLNEKINSQKDQLQEKNKAITDSMHYAKRIQGALLTTEGFMKSHLDDYFILFKPKDIVSGDFYWASEIKKMRTGKMVFEKGQDAMPTSSSVFVMATADCTGHGVPGAFMSLLNISYLNEAVNEKKIISPEKVLNHVRTRIINALSEDGSEEGGKDGMDCVLCMIDLEKMELQLAAANNPVWIIRNGNELIELKGDKMPVGKSPKDTEPFTLQVIQLQKGDAVYMLTDGYPDQFGGERGKKFKYKPLQDKLIAMNHLPMSKQKKQLDTTIENWKGDLEQVDDILIVGIRV